MENIKQYDCQTVPNIDYRFFFSDPDSDETLFFRTAEERDLCVREENIPWYRDTDGWNDDGVTNIYAGEVTHFVRKTNIEARPPANKINEEGEDEEGYYWGEDIEEICDYELLPIGGKVESK